MSITIQRFSRPQSGFTQISNDFLRAPIPAAAHRVACFILSHTDGWKVTIGGIAEALNMGRNRVSRAIGDLIELGYAIRVTLRAGGRGRSAVEALHVSDLGFTAEEREDLSAPATVHQNGARSAVPVHQNGAVPCTKTVQSRAPKQCDIRTSLLEDQEEEGGHVEAPTSLPDAPAPAPSISPDPAPAAAAVPVGGPSRNCPRHPNGTTAPCGPCGDARRAYDAAQTDFAAEAAAARRAEAAAERATKYAIIDACHRCDDKGFLPDTDVPTLCDHGQRTRKRPSIRELFEREQEKRA